MKRYNFKGGYPEMEEAVNGHWVTYHDYNLALLDANKSSERKHEAECSNEDRIRLEYEEQLSKQQSIIVGLSGALFLIVTLALLHWV